MLPRQKPKLHRHHIKPKHMGGSDEAENIVFLSIEEHAEAHRLLWEEHKKEEDYIAWKALSGQIEKTEATKMAIVSSNKRRVISQKTRELIGQKSKGRQSKLNYVTSEETKDKIRKSVKKTHTEIDYTKDRRAIYEIVFPDGSKEITNNIEKFCETHKNIPSPSCIRTQHYRGKTSWVKGKYTGFNIQKNDLTS